MYQEVVLQYHVTHFAILLFLIIVFAFTLRPDEALFKMEIEDAFEEETGIGVTGTGALEEEIRNALCEKINRQINCPSSN